MGIETIPADRLERLTPVAHHVAELVNMALNPQARVRGLVGVRAQGRPARRARSPSGPTPTSTSPPDSVGNGTRFVVSELAGQEHAARSRPRSSASRSTARSSTSSIDTLKRMEHDGYHFEVADASLELLMRRASGWEQPWFEVESFRVITDDDDPFADDRAASPPRPPSRCTSAASAMIATAEGNGPVNALDTALRTALGDRYPALASVHLTDYKVRVLDTAKGTGAVTRVLVDSHERRAHAGPRSA